jgi:hypothetical protein
MDAPWAVTMVPENEKVTARNFRTLSAPLPYFSSIRREIGDWIGGSQMMFTIALAFALLMIAMAFPFLFERL